MTRKTLLALPLQLMGAVPAFADLLTFEKTVSEMVASDQSREQVEAFALQKAKLAFHFSSK